MKVRFFASEKAREKVLARAFVAGVAAAGDTADIRMRCANPRLDGVDAAAMVGVKSHKIWRACLAAGVVPIMFDKGYIRSRRAGARTWEYWRVSPGSHHPTDLLMAEKLPPSRFDGLGVEVGPWSKQGDAILLAGSSAKYHAFYGLEEPTTWAEQVIARIRQQTDRPIIYRPKPSWREARPIEGTEFSQKEALLSVLERSRVIVTHGSNISFEGLANGIPSIVLGNGVARPISSTRLDALDNPLLGKRLQWFSNLAYWQWTEDEMASGAMWKFLTKRGPLARIKQGEAR